MNATSSQDEFAKWAKLRRSHDKLQAEYDEKSNVLPLSPFSNPASHEISFPL